MLCQAHGHVDMYTRDINCENMTGNIPRDQAFPVWPKPNWHGVVKALELPLQTSTVVSMGICLGWNEVTAGQESLASC